MNLFIILSAALVSVTAHAGFAPVTITGQNYISTVVGTNKITASAVDLSGSNVTGTIASARLPNPSTSAIGASDIDWSLLSKTGGLYTKTIAANTTFTFSNKTAGQTIVVRVLQDGTGGWTVTWPTIKWAGGTTPTQTATANKADIITCTYDGTDVFCNSVQNF